MARRPIWLWPNLLSLDAPLVAIGWFWMFKQVWLVKYHQPTLPWFLFLVVWCIYVADRLMDARMVQMGGGRDTPRHEFHRRYRKPLKIALAIGAGLALFLLANQARGLHSHGLFILIPVVIYFAVSFYDSGRVSYFKNILAGLAFGYGTAVGVHFHSREGTIQNLMVAPEVMAFAGLCILNMIAIDHWEASDASEDEEERETYRNILMVLLLVLVVASFFLGVRAEDYTLKTQKAFYLSVMLGAGCLAALNIFRARFSMDALRVLADVAMLLPLPFFYWLLVSYEILEFGKFS